MKKLVTQTIQDVLVKPLNPFKDNRGWLSELFRSDSLPDTLLPKMAYISSTKHGIARGPHEHVSQTDTFVFLTGMWIVKLWDNRPSSITFNSIMQFPLSSPTIVIVPPGVVHAYANVSKSSNGLVLNLPNVLYKGQNKALPPDEIRHESNPSFSLSSIPNLSNISYGNTDTL